MLDEREVHSYMIIPSPHLVPTKWELNSLTFLSYFMEKDFDQEHDVVIPHGIHGLHMGPSKKLKLSSWKLIM